MYHNETFINLTNFKSKLVNIKLFMDLKMENNISISPT